MNKFLYSLDNHFVENIHSQLIDDRVLLVVYCCNKPKIAKNLIAFNFSEIQFYDISNDFSSPNIYGKNICIVIDNSVTSVKKNSRIIDLINNNDAVLIASNHICKSIMNLIGNKSVLIWHNPSRYSIYNRINSIDDEKELIYVSGIKSFIKFDKNCNDIFPITTNPINEIYGIVYTDSENLVSLAKKMKYKQIICIN